MKTQHIPDKVNNDPFVTRVHAINANGDPGEAYKGDVYGHCLVDSFLGVGGAGAVYLAKHSELGVMRAIKILRRDMLLDSKTKERFLKEARLSASLNHQNIVQVHHAGEENGRLFIEMEYVEGYSLRKLMEERGQLPFPAVLAVAEQVAEALKYIHSLGKGIVHRDVKPENIMVRKDGLVKLTDFGIARCDGLTGETVTGTIIGTCGYMPLEQIDGKPLDGRSDLYSLTVVLYEMVAGLPPYTGATLTAIIRSIMASDFKPVGSIVPGLPKEFDALVRSGLKSKQASRPSDATEYLKSIKSIVSQYLGSNQNAVERCEDWLNGVSIENKSSINKSRVKPLLFVIAILAFLSAAFLYMAPKSTPQTKAVEIKAVKVIIPATDSVVEKPDTIVVKHEEAKPEIKIVKQEKRVEKEVVAVTEPVKVKEQPKSVHKTEYDHILEIENGASKEEIIQELKNFIKAYSRDTSAVVEVKSAKTKLLGLLNSN
jgi:serine/threonine protein kinase